MSSGVSVRGPRRTTEQTMSRKRRKMEIGAQGLHRYLWSRADDRGRVDLDIDVIALEWDVSYPIAHRAVKLARSDGRIRLAAWKRDRQTVYQVADPDTYKRADLDTHARVNDQPVWG